MRGFLPYPQEDMSHIDMRNANQPVGVLACCNCELFLWSGPSAPKCECSCHDTFRAWGRIMDWWT